MFTGIVQTQAIVAQITDSADFRHLTLQVTPDYLRDVALGASIAINGCCLTVVSFTDETVEFDIIDETLRLTNLGELSMGDTVNFERSLKVGDEIGGHQVSGHIHDVATVARTVTNENNWAVWVKFAPQWRRYIFPKGFIAVNGASLTIGEVTADEFSLHLIPETLRLTNLESAVSGTRLNLELDQQSIAIVDTIERILAEREQS